MGYLPVIGDDQATGKLKEVYDALKETRKWKRVSPVLRAFSRKPEKQESYERHLQEVVGTRRF